MKKLYEEHGIPDNTYLEYEEPPEFSVIYDDNGINYPFNCPFGVDPRQLRLWGEATYWTALEAALLLAGVAPDDTELYAVSQRSDGYAIWENGKCTKDGGLLGHIKH